MRRGLLWAARPAVAVVVVVGVMMLRSVTASPQLTSGQCNTCKDGSQCCDTFPTCCTWANRTDPVCCGTDELCCDGYCCDAASESCCADPMYGHTRRSRGAVRFADWCCVLLNSQGGVCCIEEETFCCPSNNDHPNRCCPRWTVCCENDSQEYDHE